MSDTETFALILAVMSVAAPIVISALGSQPDTSSKRSKSRNMGLQLSEL